ncbi:hypothetical protein OG21DRAFT_1453880 [Imleria badia]|nr:hypothetical protein OG21DRAFT_1453880 [Imleria badia]
MSTPSKKRRRVAPKNPDNTHKQPVEVHRSQFLDLPLEVFIEVFQYLELVDILHLARTTKALRAFLLDRHRSRHVWKTAIGNIPDLPPCPDHLSEPAYTHLAFIPVCHGCFKPCETIEWEIRMRCCPDCHGKLTILPYLSDDKAMKRAHSVRFPVAEGYLVIHERDMRVGFERLPPVHRPSDWEALLKRAQCPARSTKQFAEKESKLWEPIVEHARLCSKWERKRLEERATRLRLVREERVNDIKRNLEALGWTDDTCYSQAFLQHPAVSKVEPLTPIEWSKISPKLIALLPKVRHGRVTEVYRHRLNQLNRIFPARCIQDPKVNPRVRTIDILLLPDVRNVLENDINTEMSDTTISQKLGPILPELTQRWCDGAVDALTSFVLQQLGPEVDAYKAVFQCIQCQHYMAFDAALSHRHLYQEYTSTVKRRKYICMGDSEIYEEVGKEVSRSGLRNLGVLQVDKVASERIQSMSQALGGKVSIGREFIRSD